MEKGLCEPGAIVRARAGRDAGRYFVVTGLEGDYLLLCDGKTRRLESPKKKNPLHVRATRSRANLEDIKTNRALREILRPLQNQAETPQGEVIEDVEAGCH